MKPQSNQPKIKTKVLVGKNGMYFGYIYVDGKEMEKVGGKEGYMSKQNCIDYLNQRIDYHNAKQKLNIPHYIKE